MSYRTFVSLLCACATLSAMASGAQEATLVPAGAAGTAAAGSAALAPNLSNGRKLYSQVCVSCHGPEGNLIADHKLGNLKARGDFAATVGYIKYPKAPMPKLYPDLIDEQSVIDVSAFVREELR